MWSLRLRLGLRYSSTSSGSCEGRKQRANLRFILDFEVAEGEIVFPALQVQLYVEADAELFWREVDGAVGHAALMAVCRHSSAARTGCVAFPRAASGHHVDAVAQVGRIAGGAELVQPAAPAQRCWRPAAPASCAAAGATSARPSASMPGSIPDWKCCSAPRPVTRAQDSGGRHTPVPPRPQ